MTPRTLRALAAAALAASALVPTALVRGAPRMCVVHAVTGRPCPSCGLTRSWNAMGHLEFRDAARYHALGPITFLVAAALVAAGDEGTARVLEPRAQARTALALLGAAWVGAWIWRLARGDGG